MASLSALFTSNPAAISAISASGGATTSRRHSRSAPAPFLTSSALARRRTITTDLNRSGFSSGRGVHAPSPRRPGTPYPSLLETRNKNRRNDLSYGSSSRLLLLSAASAGDAGGGGGAGGGVDGGNRGGTGESEGATGELEAVGVLIESGTIGEQEAAEVLPVASDQPNQRLTAHLDLSEVKRQLQRSNERTAENLKHLRNRLHASNEWTAKHLKISNQQTRESLKHLKTRLNASNEWTISHLKRGHQWTSEHLRESNQRTREHMQHLADSDHLRQHLPHLEHLKHLKGHLNLGALKARLDASNAKTRAQLRHLGVNLEHLEGHLDVGALKASVKERAAGGADGGHVSRAASSANNRSTATKSPPVRNPYLSGNFRPVGNEVLQELDCAVIGQIPRGLRGRFIRNGPNPQLPPSSPELYHWFDGDGMVHSVNFHPPEENFQCHPREAREEIFHSSRVSYGRRYIRTTGWQEERAAGRALFGGLQQVGLGANHLLLAAMNLLGLRQQDAPMWNMTKNVSNNHFIQHAGRLLSLWEAGLPYSLDPSTLDTKGVHSFDDMWRSGMTAHPKVDPVTNHMMIYGYNLTHKPYLRYGVVDPSGSLVHATDLDLPHPVMMHDFAITQHHSIFLDFPLRFQLDKVIQSHGKAKPFVFDPSKPSRIGVLPRFGSNPDMRWFTVDPGFCLHVVNAFEEPPPPTSSSPSPSSSSSSPSSSTPDSPPPAIILRVIRFPAFSALGLAELADELACDEVARLHEYRLDLQLGAVEERSLCKVCVTCFEVSQRCAATSPPSTPISSALSLHLPHFAFPVSPLIPSFSPSAQVCCDFPSINPNFTGRPHRFAYSARFTAQPGPGEGEGCRGMDLRDVEGWRWVDRDGDGGQGGGLVDSSPIGSFTLPDSQHSQAQVSGAEGCWWVAGMQVGGQGCRWVGRDAGTTVPSFNAIMKHDFQQGTYQVHTLPPGRFCGEPVFAPRHHFQSSSRSQSGEARSDEVGMGRDVVGLGADAVGMGAEEEDDGWVLAHVWDEEEMRSEVIVLDAMNLDKQPLARVILPKRVPYGFHGTFLPD
ncbi:unnamed protein product [Closterium sp. Naga37s-1]|nr:unnamed protein product [Closterium sp. Naga37s-1]